MLKQLLTSGFILALLLVNSLSAQAKLKEPRLQFQVQNAPPTTPEPDGSMTSPGSDGSITTPAPDATTNPGSDSSKISSGSGSNKGGCESIPSARPTGGATRERLQAIQSCK